MAISQVKDDNWNIWIRLHTRVKLGRNSVIDVERFAVLDCLTLESLNRLAAKICTYFVQHIAPALQAAAPREQLEAAETGGDAAVHPVVQLAPRPGRGWGKSGPGRIIYLICTNSSSPFKGVFTDFLYIHSGAYQTYVYFFFENVNVNLWEVNGFFL